MARAWRLNDFQYCLPLSAVLIINGYFFFQQNENGGLQCTGLTQDDLPLTGYDGEYAAISFISCNFKVLIKDAIPSTINVGHFELLVNRQIQRVERGFAGESTPNIRSIYLNDNTLLE